MANQMTHWERVRAALRGDDVDQPPISVWRHFYQRENSVEGLAEAMLGFQKQNDWDFMKVNPRANYHAEDWGLKQHLSGSDIVEPGGGRLARQRVCGPGCGPVFRDK